MLPQPPSSSSASSSSASSLAVVPPPPRDFLSLSECTRGFLIGTEKMTGLYMLHLTDPSTDIERNVQLCEQKWTQVGVKGMAEALGSQGIERGDNRASGRKRQEPDMEVLLLASGGEGCLTTSTPGLPGAARRLSRGTLAYASSTGTADSSRRPTSPAH